MEPSGKTRNVLLFTGTEAGARYGYPFDGWQSDGTFHYTGEGSVGPQVMTFGNKAVRDHAADGRALRLFEKQGNTPLVRYLGEFKLPQADPWTEADARGTDQVMRSLFVFRLQPVGAAWEQPAASPAQASAELTPQLVPLEAANVDAYVAARITELISYLHNEAALVGR